MTRPRTRRADSGRGHRGNPKARGAPRPHRCRPTARRRRARERAPRASGRAARMPSCPAWFSSCVWYGPHLTAGLARMVAENYLFVARFTRFTVLVARDLVTRLARAVVFLTARLAFLTGDDVLIIDGSVHL